MASRNSHNGGPPLAFTAKVKLERIQHIVERTDLTSAQKCVGIGIVVSADKEWVAEVKTAQLQTMASVKDKETVFKATKKLAEIELIAKAHAKGQSGRYNILPPQIIEAVMEALDELQSSRVKPDGVSNPAPPTSPVGFDRPSPEKPVGFDRTSPVQSDQPSCAPIRARLETPSGLLKPKKVEDKSPFIPQSDDERVTFENGRLELRNGLKQFWLDKFGDPELLELALIQAAGYVQPNSTKPLEAQVSAQLARKVATKRDQDARYAKAVKANSAKTAGETEGESRSERWARKLQQIAAEDTGKGSVK
jgi:hypothetical protein